MPLTPPKLDDRAFETLFEEARSRIPRFLPEWTDWNESDPGITLLQLHAWLTETVLYRLNQVPELHFIKFLQLLGVDQRPARAAKAHLTFTLSDGIDRAEVLIPKGVLTSVADRDLPEPVFFETERSLRAIEAKLERIIQAPPGGQPPRDVTHTNEADGRTVLPFCGGYGPTEQCLDEAVAGAALLFGFASALPFPRDEIGLFLYLAEEGRGLLADAADLDCAGDGAGDGGPDLAWEWWDGTEWSALDITGDDTRALTESGQVFFRVPGQIPAVPSRAIDGQPAPAPPQLADVAGIAPFLAELQGAGILTVGALAQQDEAALCTLLVPADADDATREALKADIAAMLADAQRLVGGEEIYYWLRVRLRGGQYAEAPRLDRVLTNTVEATAARTVASEVVIAAEDGRNRSNGRPNQAFTLANAPILAEPEPRLEVPESPDEVRVWQRVADFAASGPDDDHYRLNRATGEILFGDGRHGRIPPASQQAIVARSYRYGGGRIGNVGADTITDLLSPIRDVDSITNVRPAAGGDDEEPLSETRLRVPKEVLKARNRAVTLEDFEVLARATPGALVARAHAYVEVEVDAAGCERRGIRVVVMPQSSDPKPLPSEAMLRLVCRYLDARRLITTPLSVTGPRYRDFDVLLAVVTEPNADLRTVKNALGTHLGAFFHPLSGGHDGRGLVFGRAVAYSTVVREIMAVPGVVRIEDLVLRKLLRERPSFDAAQAGRAADLAAERAAFDVSCTPTAEALTVVEPSEQEGAVTSRYFTAARYTCCDMPVATGELPALRTTEIAVRPDREIGR